MVDFLKDQRLETEMNQYWTERSKSYSEQNRAQIENEKRCEWENMILKYAPQKERLNILDVGTGPGFFCDYISTKRASSDCGGFNKRYVGASKRKRKLL